MSKVNSDATRPRIVVIGAGLLGSSVASHAAARGAEVVLVDAHHGPNRGASRWSYAWLNSNNKSPDWYHRLNVRGMEEYPHLAETLGGEGWYFPVGHLMWSSGASPLWPGETSQPVDDIRIERLRRLDYPVERLSANGVRELEPAIDPEVVSDALFFPTEGWVDTDCLVRSLLRYGEMSGSIEYRWGTSVCRFEVVGARVRGMVTDSGDALHGDVFVNCAGANAAAVARLVGVEIGAGSRPAVVAVTEETAVELRHVLHIGEMSIRPHPNRRLMLHRNIADGTVGAGPVGHDVPAAAIGALRDGVRACLGTASVELETVALVDMPMPSDGHPAVGRLSPWENVYLAVTHSGATIGPLLGRLLAEQLLTGDSDEALDACAPDRLIAVETTAGANHQLPYFPTKRV